MTDHPMLRWFVADHLPPDLREVSEPFGRLAQTMVEQFPAGFQLTTCLQRLWRRRTARSGLHCSPARRPFVADEPVDHLAELDDPDESVPDLQARVRELTAALLIAERAIAHPHDGNLLAIAQDATAEALGARELTAAEDEVASLRVERDQARHDAEHLAAELTQLRAAAERVRARCLRWVDYAAAGVGAGEYGQAGAYVLALLLDVDRDSDPGRCSPNCYTGHTFDAQCVLRAKVLGPGDAPGSTSHGRTHSDEPTRPAPGDQVRPFGEVPVADVDPAMYWPATAESTAIKDLSAEERAAFLSAESEASDG